MAVQGLLPYEKILSQMIKLGLHTNFACLQNLFCILDYYFILKQNYSYVKSIRSDLESA